MPVTDKDHLILVILQSRSQSFVPLDQRSENESSGSIHFTMRQKCAIDTIDADCALRRETGCAEFGYFLCYFKMDAPRALVFPPLVKGNEAQGTRLVILKTVAHAHTIVLTALINY